MARFLRQGGACTGGHKGAGLSDCKARIASRVTLRSVGRAVGAIPRSVHEPTKRPKHPGCSAAAPLRGDAEEQAALVVAGAVSAGSSPSSPGRRRHGVLEHSHRGGERGILRRSAPPKAVLTPPDPTPFTRRCSAHAARIRKESGSLPPPRRASSNAPSSPRKWRRPREGDAERVDRRHGSSASSHGLHGPGSLLSRGASATLPRTQKTRGREDEVARFRSRVRASGQTGRGFLARWATVGGANADRGGSLARRRIHGSRACPRVEYALQRSVVQSWSREAVGTFPRS